ncbi:hypothetical protein ACGF7U_19810 [Micromonospora sp. NPDC047670]|uniref:hypothetical protein n=1 Tax=Micromonospora sp. NPDC047670 TaxID=3364252 RepID=UPI0037129279
MARWGIATGTLLTAVALGLGGCGAAEVAGQPARDTGVEVARPLGAEGQALAALGFDAGDLDVDSVAAPASPTPPAASGEKPRRERADEGRERRKARVLLRRNTLHGEAVVKTRDGGTKTIAVQRGEVTAVDGDSMTVRSADGFTMTWTFGDKLRVVERRTTIRSADIKVGTTVGVAGAKDGDNGIARLIVVPVQQR